MAIQPRAASRKLRLLPAIAALGMLVVLVSGCGREPAAQANSPTNVKPGSVPAIATAYGSVVDLTLQTTVKQGALLLERMKSDSPYSLGTLCTDAGLQYSYQYNAFRNTYTPLYARAAATAAVAGYKLALSAMDECGNAADSGDPHAMKIAAKDFYNALAGIATAEHTVGKWVSATH